MASITFNPSTDEKGNKIYVAEFQVTEAANLYIKRSSGAPGRVYQKQSESHDYASSRIERQINWGDPLICEDFSTDVYPKYLKIVSYSSVISAEYTYNS